jgi:pilus assembly protein CpaE
MLQKQGFQTITAGSGHQGITLAQTTLPDLILLDIMMPGMDGYEVARHLRADKTTADIPITMFSAKSNVDDKIAGFEAGADDYLTKPTPPSDLQAHIKALLARTAKPKTSALPALTDQAYVIGFIAARGGLGVTTIASNLAGNIKNKLDVGVILAEFRPGQGTLAYDLDLEKTDGLTELLNTPAEKITSALIGEKLVRVTERISILPSSPEPKDAALAQNVDQFEAIMQQFKTMAQYVVVDLGSGLTTVNQKLAPYFNELFVIAEPYDHSIRHAQSLVDNLLSLGVDKFNLFVALNYHLRAEFPQLNVVQAQQFFKVPIDITFTPAPELYMRATQMHLIASLTALESVTAVQFSTLATKIQTRAHKHFSI